VLSTIVATKLDITFPNENWFSFESGATPFEVIFLFNRPQTRTFVVKIEDKEKGLP
jgi:hypothetical protein